MDKYLELVELVLLENTDETVEEYQETMDLLYKIVHLARWKCKNPHNDWKKEVDLIIKEANL